MVFFILLALFALLFLVLGIQFMRGRWLNLIAGNNFVSKEEMKTSYQRRLGRLVAAPMFAAACALAFQAASALLRFKGVDDMAVTTDILMGVCYAICTVLLVVVMVKANKR